jgi:predicted membrane channel-forming protein YqfA (hemolysin III family)
MPYGDYIGGEILKIGVILFLIWYFALLLGIILLITGIGGVIMEWKQNRNISLRCVFYVCLGVFLLAIQYDKYSEPPPEPRPAWKLTLAELTGVTPEQIIARPFHTWGK